jgi:hypothetical protein
MSTVVVERSFDRPVAFEEIQALEERGAGCLEAHGVRFLKTYFSRDRRHMYCLYEAPDAESVRLAQQKAGVPFDEAWTARIIRHQAGGPDGQTVVAKRTFPQPVDEETLRATAVITAGCLQIWGARVEWSYLAPDGCRCLCVFTAPDAESVRQAQKQSGLPFDAVWSATVHEPPPAAR